MGSLVGFVVLLFPWDFFAHQENQSESTHHISETVLHLPTLTVFRPCLSPTLPTLPQALKRCTTAIAAMRGGADNVTGYGDGGNKATQLQR